MYKITAKYSWYRLRIKLLLYINYEMNLQLEEWIQMQ